MKIAVLEHCWPATQDEEDPSAVFDRLLGERQREEAGTLPRQAVKEFILSRGDSDEKLAAWADTNEPWLASAVRSPVAPFPER